MGDWELQGFPANLYCLRGLHIVTGCNILRMLHDLVGKDDMRLCTLNFVKPENVNLLEMMLLKFTKDCQIVVNLWSIHKPYKQ